MPRYLGYVVGDTPVDVIFQSSNDLRPPLLPPLARGRDALAITESQRVRQRWVWISQQLVIVGVIRVVLITARAGAQLLDTELLHHVLVILVRRESDGRRQCRLAVRLRGPRGRYAQRKSADQN